MKIERIKSFKITSKDELYIVFEDGFAGTLRLKEHLKFVRPIEKDLLDQSFFQKAVLNPEFGCIEWPNGFDISPEYLKSLLAA